MNIQAGNYIQNSPKQNKASVKPKNRLFSSDGQRAIINAKRRNITG
jgi:hypothetical protein